MIISSIMNALFNLISNWITVVVTPLEGVENIFTYSSMIFTNGVDIFQFFFPPAARVILLVIVSAYALSELYFLVLWILKKIPFIDMK